MIFLVVKEKPGVFKAEITFDTEGELTIKIRERPIDSTANDYFIRFLAKKWDMRRSDVLLEKGLSSRCKKILLNSEPEEFLKILNKYRK